MSAGADDLKIVDRADNPCPMIGGKFDAIGFRAPAPPPLDGRQLGKVALDRFH